MTNQQLPIPDVDDLVLGDVRSRIRTLQAPELDVLLRHEQQHRARLPVVLVLQERLGQLDARLVRAHPGRG